MYLTVFSFYTKLLFVTRGAFPAFVYFALLFISLVYNVSKQREFFIFRTYKTIFLFIVNKMIAVIRVLFFICFGIHLLIWYINDLISFIQLFKIIESGIPAISKNFLIIFS